MARFRKKPVVIEAWRYARYRGACDPMPGWLTDAMADRRVFWLDQYTPAEKLAIKTLEGRMEATPGDWIIQGVEGEIYPCKPRIFDATYEPEEAIA